MSSMIRVGLITSLGAMAALAACGGTKTTTLYGDAQAAPEVREAPSMGLADLAQRDVDAFLSRREQIASAAERERSSGSPGGEILWHRSVSARSTGPSTANREEAGDQDRFEQPTLNREAVRLPEVLDAPSDADPVASDARDVAEAEGAGLDRDRLRELLIDLSKELYRDAAYSDMPLRELLLIAATTMVRPDRALQPEAIPGLTERERELLAIFQAFFAELGERLDGGRNADEVLSESVDLLRAALRTEPRLELGTVALCTRVGGFGDYDPFNRYAFLAHAEQKAIVYIEVTNFTSELNAKEQWVTELSQQLTIYSDRDGIPVWREDWQSAVDVTKNRRNDFFVVQIITLPKALGVGKYHLKIRVRDEKSRAETEGAIHFELVADPKMAATVR